MAERKSAGDKGIIGGVKLPFDPVGPDPIEIILDRFRIHQTTGMKQHAGSQQLNGLAHLGGLRKIPHLRQQGDRIQKPISPRRPRN